MSTPTTRKAQPTKLTIFSNMPDFECCESKSNGCDCAYHNLHDEKMNLDVVLPSRVIAIADLGLWNGRRPGYRLLTDNLNSMFLIMEDYNEFFSDGNSIYSRNIHHDGTNKIEYRLVRPGVNIDLLTKRIHSGEWVSRDVINRFTVSLHPYVAEVFGWKSRPKAKV